MSVNLSTIATNLRIEAPGCLDSMIVDKLRDSLIEFCEETNIWRYEPDTVYPSAGETEYEIDLPDGAQVASFLGDIKHGTSKVKIKTLDWLTKNVPNWSTDTGTIIEYLYFISMNDFRLVPVMSDTPEDQLKFPVIALKPTQTATTMDDKIYAEYREFIESGAKARLMMMPERQWSNEKLSLYYAAHFGAGISKAKAKARSGFNTENREREVRAHTF